MRPAFTAEQILDEVSLRTELGDLSARSSGPVGSLEDLTEWGLVLELRDHVVALQARLPQSNKEPR